MGSKTKVATSETRRRRRAAAVDPAILEALAPDTLLDCLEARVRQARRVAFRIHGVDEPQQTIRRGALWEAIDAAARRLRALGVRPGDRVLLVLPTSADFIYFFWGILRAAATPAPAYPPAGWRQLAVFSDTLGRHASITGARLAIVPAVLRDVLRESGVRGLAAEAVVAPQDIWDAPPAPDLPAPPGPDHIALVQFSSGSTGDPRGICLSQTNLLANIRGFARRMELQTDDVLVTWLPLYHDMGLIGTMIAPLAIGMPVVLFPPTDFLRRPEHWLRVMGKYGATISVAPQFAYSLCDRKVDPAQIDGVDLSPLRILLNGAEPIHPDDVTAFERRFRCLGMRRHVVTPCYGLAEGTLAVTMQQPGRGLVVRARPVERHGDPPPERHQDPIVVSSGPPLHETEVRIRADGSAWQREGRVGEICVRGASVCTGHLTRGGIADAVDARGWLHTGDLGFLRDGELYVTGRKKDLVIVGGRNLYPQEIEAEVAKMAGFRPGRIAAFGLTEPSRGTEVLVILVEPLQEGSSDAAESIAAVRHRIFERFGVSPYDVVLVKRGHIPLTTSGKLRRFEARAAYERGEFGSLVHRGTVEPAEKKRRRR